MTTLADTTPRLEKTYSAPPERVFRAFVEPELLAQWYAPNDDMEARVDRCDAREGGEWSISFGPRGKGFPYNETGTFLEIRPPTKLVYRMTMTGTDHDADLVDTVATFELTPTGDGGTLLVLTHSGYGSKRACDLHKGGWPGFLDKIARVI